MGDADSFVGNYEFQVPIFVLTHPPPRVAPKQDEPLTFTFVTDGVESAVAQAKAADIRSLSVRMELPRWRLSRAGLGFATGNSPNDLRRIFPGKNAARESGDTVRRLVGRRLVEPYANAVPQMRQTWES